MNVQQCAEEFELYLNRLSYLIQQNSEMLLTLPNSIATSINPNTADRISDHRSKVAIIREVVGRKELKVVFFGRTSSGKSSAINALLGTKVLPTGLGHTTSCFINVSGTASETPLMRAPVSQYIPSDEEDTEEAEQFIDVHINSLSDLANALKEYSLGPNRFVQILWPKHSCPLLLENPNVILVDSPGVDLDGDFDCWIENYCMDAEIFVLVVNAESTLMMREKTFFKKVAEKVTKPNLLVLLNRWDCASEEEEYLIHAAQDQHITRVCDFLTKELKTVDDVEDAQKRIYFVSAKEAALVSQIKQDASCNSPLKFQRCQEWDRFNKDVKGFLCLANRGGKYLPYIRASISISKELEMFQQSIFQLASTKLEALQTKKAETLNKLKDLHDRMEILTVELNLEIKTLLNGIEVIVRSVYQDEIENVAVLVSGFEAPFYNDQAVLNLYKQHLVRFVEMNLMENLRGRLTRKIASTMELAQASMLDKIGELLSPDQRDFILLTPHTIPFEMSYVLDCNSTLSKFKEDIDFDFTLSPYNIYSRSMQLQLRARNFLERHKRSHELNNGQQEDPDASEEDNITSHLGKLLLSEKSTAAANELVSAAGEIALTSISEAKEDTATIALSAAVVYSALYICERAMWTLAAREQQFKSQFIQFAMGKLPDLEFPLTLGIRQQIHRELTTMLGVACGTVEATSDDLKIDLSKMEDEMETLEEAVNMASILIEKSQDIQYNMERVNDRLSQNM